MMGCDTCAFAKWKTTTNGRLHPDGSGRCTFVWSPPPMPKSFSFSFRKPGELPIPSGGYISRNSTTYDNCACWVQR